MHLPIVVIPVGSVGVKLLTTDLMKEAEKESVVVSIVPSAPAATFMFKRPRPTAAETVVMVS